jgi:SAM-dependent methyltransferase
MPAALDSPAVDQRKIEAFVGQIVCEVGAVLNAALVVLGDRLGLYRALADGEPVDAATLAERTGTAERVVREWLHAQAAGGYVLYDATDGTFRLPPEHAAVLADETSPAFACGAFQLAASTIKDEHKLREAFRRDGALGWHEHHHDLFEGWERFFRASYDTHLVRSWLPTLDGVEERLERGCRVADVGCGRGASTILMARAYPESTFTGFDYHFASVEAARERARRAEVFNAHFEMAPSKGFPGGPYDVVTMFDCLHDMGDPVGAARHVRETLADDGVWMIVEPYAGDRLEDNLTPVGRVYYGASALICTPASLSQEVGLALGSQAGEARIREVCAAGGFTRFRRAAETRLNLVFEVRP